ncbi:unnamed protein product [Boreogadus saida]
MRWILDRVRSKQITSLTADAVETTRNDEPVRNVIPGQTLAIGYGRSRVALGRSNSFKLQQTPAFNAEPQMRTQTPTPIPTSNRPKAAASTIWASSVALGTGKQVPAVQDQGQTCEQARR